MKRLPTDRLKEDVAEVISDRRMDVQLTQRRLAGAELALLMVQDWPREKLLKLITLSPGAERSWAPPWAGGLFDAAGFLTPEAKEAIALLRELLNPDPKDDR